MTSDATATVLVVEDDPVSLGAISEYLSRQGYSVLVARDGNLARALFERELDLVILDLHLPDTTGIDLLKELKGELDHHHLPVICITASDDMSSIEAAFQAGALDYMIKPYNQYILSAKVKTLIDLKRKTEKLAALTHKDALTDVYNRRSLDEMLPIEWRRMKREEKPLSLVMVDIDDFKKVNDVLGHQAGDECIKQVADSLKSLVRRAGDIIIRYGGDEFLLILPDVDIAQAVKLANNIRSQVSENCVDCDKRTVNCEKITVTLGCASVIPSDSSSPEVLLKQADMQLYEAKVAGGKNCVRPQRR